MPETQKRPLEIAYKERKIHRISLKHISTAISFYTPPHTKKMRRGAVSAVRSERGRKRDVIVAVETCWPLVDATV